MPPGAKQEGKPHWRGKPRSPHGGALGLDEGFEHVAEPTLPLALRLPVLGGRWHRSGGHKGQAVEM